MAEAPEIEARRLHASTLFLRGIGVLPGLALLALPLLRGMEEMPPFLFAMVILAILYAVVGLPFTIAYYVRFRYFITPREIVIKSGVLTRQHRSIPIERVQNVEIRQPLLPRLLGVARVQLETAGSQTAEGVLEYVSLQEARDIRTVVREHQRRAPAGASGVAPVLAEQLERQPGDVFPEEVAPQPAVELVDTPQLLLRMPPYRVLLSGMYRFSLLYILLVFSGIQYLNVEPEEIVGWFTGGMFEPVTRIIAASPWLAAFTGIVLAALFSWIAGILVNVNRYYGFTLSLEGDKLHRRHGLMTVLEGTIPLRKVQAAVLRANVGMRLRNWQMLKLQTMGLDADQHGNQIAVPFARREEILDVTPAVLPFSMPDSFRNVSRLQIRRLTIRYTLMLAAAVGLASWLISPDAVWGLTIWPVLPVFAYFQYRNHGYHFDGTNLFVRSGVVTHHVWVLPIDRLQALYGNATYFQRRLGLSTLLVDTAGATTYPAPDIRDLAEGDASSLLGELHAAAQVSAGVAAPRALPF